jgi:hypothetical protein
MFIMIVKLILNASIIIIGIIDIPTIYDGNV